MTYVLSIKALQPTVSVAETQFHASQAKAQRQNPHNSNPMWKIENISIRINMGNDFCIKNSFSHTNDKINNEFRYFFLDCFFLCRRMIYVCTGEKFTMIEFDFHSGFKGLKLKGFSYNFYIRIMYL